MNTELTKRTPIHEIARRAGASFVEQDGWLLADAFGGAQDWPTLDGFQVALADRSARARVLVEGQAAAALVARAWDLPALAVNRGALLPQGQGATYRLRHDRFYFGGPPGAGGALISALEAARQDQDGLITVTDATHGRAELWLLGPAAAELLSRLCGLDFHPAEFPNLAAKQTSVARTAQLVVRADIGRHAAYALVGARSLGAYLWQTIVEAAHDLQLQLCGEALLQALQEQQESHAAP